MLVQCIKTKAFMFGRRWIKFESLTVGKLYLVLEIYNDKEKSYRIIDDNNGLGIFPGKIFEIYDDDMSGMVTDKEFYNGTCYTHPQIIKNKFICSGYENFWDYFFCENDIQAYIFLQKIIDELNRQYRLPLKPIWFDTEFDTVDFEAAKRLRSGFVRKFVDTDSEIYREIKKIDPNELTEDKNTGLYLRDILLYDKRKVISYADALEFLKELGDNVYLMWDIRRKYIGSEPDAEDIYFRKNTQFNSDTVLCINSDIVCELIRFDNTEGRYAGYEDRMFPEDLYIFDESMDWYIIITHSFFVDENYRDTERICFIGEAM